MNPVARGDLVARLGSPRGIRLLTIYLAVCSGFLLLSLPPEVGRLDLRDASLLLAVLAGQVVAVTYLCSAVASSELSLEGEKGLSDLALSAFSPRAIAAGKVISSLAYAVYLLAIGLPLFVLSAALRGAALVPIVWSSVLAAALATTAGIWGVWLAGRFNSDFTRSLVHWTLLALVFGGTALLPPEWWPANPIRLIDVLVREGWSPWLGPAVAGYALLGVLGTVMIAKHIRDVRAHGEAS